VIYISARGLEEHKKHGDEVMQFFFWVRRSQTKQGSCDELCDDTCCEEFCDESCDDTCCEEPCDKNKMNRNKKQTENHLASLGGLS
jgi:hypothetical protein